MKIANSESDSIAKEALDVALESYYVSLSEDGIVENQEWAKFVESLLMLA